MSYGELWELSTAVVALINARRPGARRVGLCTTRTVTAHAGHLAVLRLAATLVPVMPEHASSARLRTAMLDGLDCILMDRSADFPPARDWRLITVPITGSVAGGSSVTLAYRVRNRHAGVARDRHGVLRIRVLGSLDLELDGDRLCVGGPRERRLLAALVINAGRPVPATRLVRSMWDDEPPRTAARQVNNAIARLRRNLADARSAVVTDGSAYRIDATATQIDVIRFEEEHRRGREQLAAGELAPAVDTLTRALALWRGPAFCGIPGDTAGRAAVRLEDLRLTAAEDLIGARLDLGEAEELIPWLLGLVTDHPTRERLQRLNMLALFRAGRVAEALRAFERTRAALSTELGADPGTELRLLHRRILRDDPALAAIRATSTMRRA